MDCLYYKGEEAVKISGIQILIIWYVIIPQAITLGLPQKWVNVDWLGAWLATTQVQSLLVLRKNHTTWSQGA